MKILFVSRASGLFHCHQSIIEALLKRGYEVVLLLDSRESLDKEIKILDDFQGHWKNFKYDYAVQRKDYWSRILFPSREVLNFRRYLLLEGKQSAYYRDRWRPFLPRTIQKTASFPGVERLLKARLAGFVLSVVEKILPPDKKIVQHLKSIFPDIVLASPVVNLRRSGADTEYLKAARHLKIPTAMQVVSWDSLTTKGLIHIKPDIVLAWNKKQAEEAVVYQDIPVERIRIIGAPPFDSWFTKLKPSLTRAEFCKKYNLRESDPIITYLGSSHNISQDESWLAKKFREDLDSAAEPRIRNIQVIIRPHPGNFKIYRNLNMKDVAMIPETGTLPNTADSLQLFYDTLHHSIAAVLGVNTSGIIDSIIAGKPALVLITGDYQKTQTNTIHFKQLLEADVLNLIKEPLELHKILDGILKGRDEKKEFREKFVRNFVRPHGLEISAGQVAASAIENLLKSANVYR